MHNSHDEMLKKYLQHCRFEKGLDEKTLKAYSTDLEQFHKYILNIGNDYSKECVQAYIVAMQEKYAVKSTKRKIASIKAYCNYLEYEGLIENNPFSRMRIKLHEPFLLPRTIPLPTIQKLLQCAYQQVSTANASQYRHQTTLRDIAVLELLFATGMRISELCSLQKDDIDFAEQNIRIYGKGGKERFVQIGNQAVLNALLQYYGVFAERIDRTGNFFINRLGHQLSDQSVRFMICSYCQLADIDLHITPHMFRHSFATLLLEEDVDIRYIQQLLGHSSIVTTQIYTHVSTKKQREILVTKHPRNKLSMQVE